MPYKDRALTERERRLVRRLFPGGWKDGEDSPDLIGFVEQLGTNNDLVKAVLEEALQHQKKVRPKGTKCKKCGIELRLTRYQGEYCKTCSPARNVNKFRSGEANE